MAALALIVGGIFFPNFPKNIGIKIPITLIGLGAGLLLLAVVLPTVSQVEFGVPSVFKITGAIRNREEKLRQVFDAQRLDLETCAKLLCDDPATTNDLLTAAMKRATSEWRGPIDGEIRKIRNYVLCLFVNRLWTVINLAGTEPPATPRKGPVFELTPKQRFVVVLTWFKVPIEEIAYMVDLPLAEAQAELSCGERALTDAGRRGDV